MRQVLDTVKRDEIGTDRDRCGRRWRCAKHAGAVDGDNNGFVNIPLAAREVVAVVYMREVGAGRIIA